MVCVVFQWKHCLEKFSLELIAAVISNRAIHSALLRRDRKEEAL
jgi:hypothetical protein